VRLLVATDGSAHAQCAVALAAHLAGEMRDPEVVVVHVVHIPALAYGAAAEYGALEESLEDAGRRYLGHAVEQFAALTVRVTALSRNGDPADEIIRAARDTNAELIVLGCRGRGRVEGLVLGSVSEHVLHGASIPVLIVR
jgi:nucleotide-binding universal stress UspA family protein